MRTTAIILLGWLAVSIVFGCLWVLAAMTIKAARRRWPGLVGDRPLFYPAASPRHQLEEEAGPRPASARSRERPAPLAEPAQCEGGEVGLAQRDPAVEASRHVHSPR